MRRLATWAVHDGVVLVDLEQIVTVGAMPFAQVGWFEDLGALLRYVEMEFVGWELDGGTKGTG